MIGHQTLAGALRRLRALVAAHRVEQCGVLVAGPKLGDRVHLQLADPLAGDAVPLGDRLERLDLARLEPEAQAQDLSVPLVEVLHRIVERLAERGPIDCLDTWFLGVGKHLEQLGSFASVEQLLAHARSRTVEPVEPRIVMEGEVARILLPGDEGY